MDEKKKEVLESIDYQIRKCCGNCEYSCIRKGTNWGTCVNVDYYHARHFGGFKTNLRSLSINAYGYCKQHTFVGSFTFDAYHYKSFFEKNTK